MSETYTGCGQIFGKDGFDSQAPHERSHLIGAAMRQLPRYQIVGGAGLGFHVVLVRLFVHI